MPPEILALIMLSAGVALAATFTRLLYDARLRQARLYALLRKNQLERARQAKIAQLYGHAIINSAPKGSEESK